MVAKASKKGVGSEPAPLPRRAAMVLLAAAMATLAGASALPLNGPGPLATPSLPGGGLAAAPLPHYATLAEGIAALSKATGIPLPSGILERASQQETVLGAARARISLDLVAGTVRAAELRQQAMAGLAPAEKAALAAGPTGASPSLAYRQAAAKVDAARMAAASTTLHRAAGRATAALDDLLGAPLASEAATGCLDPDGDGASVACPQDAPAPAPGLCPDDDGDGSWVPCSAEGQGMGHAPVAIDQCIDPQDAERTMDCDECPAAPPTPAAACGRCLDPDGDGHVFACHRTADGSMAPNNLSPSSCTDGRMPGCDPYDNDCDANLQTGQDDYYPAYENHCICPPPSTWSPPKCVCPTPPGPAADPANGCCPPPTTGVWPDCAPPPPPRPTCPPPTYGTWPNCRVPPQPCPPPSTGTVPNCQVPVPACPIPWPLPPPAVDLGPFLAYSTGTAANGFNQDVIVSLDDGGDDAYCNNAGATYSAGAPFDTLGVARCSEFAPVAVLIDHGGNDRYHSPYDLFWGGDETDSVATFCFEGSTSAGVADFTDEQGDDQYNSHHAITDFSYAACGSNPSATLLGPMDYVARWNQGYAGVGRASLMDLSGDDQYNSYNDLCTPTAVTRMAIDRGQGAADAAAGQGSMQDLAGNDAYNSGNVAQPACGPGADLPLSIMRVQGAATAGNASLDDGQGNDLYNSGNQVSVTCTPAGYPTLMAYTALAIDCAQGCAEQGGTARHHDGKGKDDYNSDDGALVATTNQEQPELVGRFVVSRVQGSADGASALPLAGHPSQARLDDDAGDDSYQSRDWLDAWAAFLSITASQGYSHGGDGTFTDRAGMDLFNSLDRASGTMPVALANPDVPAPYSARMVIDGVQGVATAASGRGMMDADVDVVPSMPMPGSDLYNSQNTLLDNGGAGAVELDITRVQGVADSPTPSSGNQGILVDHGGDDQYDAGNGGSLGGMGLHGALGAVGGWAGPAAPFADGVGRFRDDAGKDQYAVGNFFGPPSGPCVVPGPGSLDTCVDWIVGVSAAPAGLATGASFKDATPFPTPDAWFPWAPSLGMGTYSTLLNVGGTCSDAGDGPEMPPGHGCTDT